MPTEIGLLFENLIGNNQSADQVLVTPRQGMCDACIGGSPKTWKARTRVDHNQPTSGIAFVDVGNWCLGATYPLVNVLCSKYEQARCETVDAVSGRIGVSRILAGIDI